eukprot:CAMPEP_0174849740 /NCGR_PEP_ID=MMETSP1114-20130205/17098_1 /TAXON_ID=312471 /ORGANISM="Neobodo designis, Strain CCAP 1951/1" /LENGTH=291 /DNA_ID=CAMNT_0016084133 /DNA_START=31 /DNA_END=906 /DNA_ORIENTATION=+
MLRRGAFAATSLARMSLLGLQPECVSTPVTTNDQVVSSMAEEALPPQKQTQMVQKYGNYAKYANPAFTKVDTTEEIVLNQYPEGPLEGRLENTGHDPANYKASYLDEAFFRKHVLKPASKTPEGNEIVDWCVNALIMGLFVAGARHLLLPIWWVGQPKLTMVYMSNMEVEIPEMVDKENKTIVWRGKPIYVYKRSEAQMKALEETPLSALKDPETDEQRFPEQRRFAVVIAICTHLGCVPAANEGAFNGFFCPCHGSHYDASARIRVGPAPLNLEVPPNKWIDENTLYLGN